MKLSSKCRELREVAADGEGVRVREGEGNIGKGGEMHGMPVNAGWTTTCGVSVEVDEGGLGNGKTAVQCKGKLSYNPTSGKIHVIP